MGGYKTPKQLQLVFFFFLLFLLHVFSQSNNNSISHGNMITDGEIIVSPRQVFALGFFSPANSSLRYVGIWYYGLPGDPTVIWVANRDAPLSDNSGVFGIQNNGSLSLSDGNGREYWTTGSFPGNLTAVLVDTGNFMLSTVANAGDDENALWQSCGNPTDTYLPNMRVYMNITRGDGIFPFDSWRSSNDPSKGNYSMEVDARGSPQIILRDGSRRRVWRSGPWNRQIFTGLPQMRSILVSGFRLVPGDDGDVMYFVFNNPNMTRLTRFMVTWNGEIQQLTWDEGRLEWDVSLTLPSTVCQRYNRCGSYGICNERNTRSICSCMRGFERNSSGECVRRTPLECRSNSSTNDGFLRIDGVKLPDIATNNFDAQNREECEDACSDNCSCNAYAFVIGIGCLTWGGDLVDIEEFEEGGETIYVRLADSELGGGKASMTAIIAISVTGVIVFGLILWLIWRCRGNIKGISNIWRQQENSSQLIFLRPNSVDIPAGAAIPVDLSAEGKSYEGTLYSLISLESATDGFANKNKLGEGGFGPVHKGVLPGGQEIAVKRLSKWSGQGLMEFKNEMILIAKLQHRNLVRLLGYCIEGEENMLVYEYLPNKSLDTFLFDAKKKVLLDWKTRFMIIEGIARGILYLHRDSRLRIIHRDLKASNILLDVEMIPKISDFGMARIFGGNQNEANTVRVVGTYGYMSPEYAMEGLFSVKSDVYSFGVLLLEIISGKRNTSFRSHDATNLIKHAWNLWKDGKPEELIDPSILDSCNMKEALKCIHVGMLCVQFSAVHRPTMSSVVYMLESESTSLPLPTEAGDMSLNSPEVDMTMEGREITVSSNDVTVTEVIGR